MKLNIPKCSIQSNVRLRKENEQYRSPDAWFSVDVALALVVSENDKKTSIMDYICWKLKSYA